MGFCSILYSPVTAYGTAFGVLFILQCEIGSPVQSLALFRFHRYCCMSVVIQPIVLLISTMLPVKFLRVNFVSFTQSNPVLPWPYCWLCQQAKEPLPPPLTCFPCEAVSTDQLCLQFHVFRVYCKVQAGFFIFDGLILVYCLLHAFHLLAIVVSTVFDVRAIIMLVHWHSL
jgi:hypothetical protein